MNDKSIKLVCKNVIEENNSYVYYFANALDNSLKYPLNGKINLCIIFDSIEYNNQYVLLSNSNDALNNVYKIIVTPENYFSNLFIKLININSFVDCFI